MQSVQLRVQGVLFIPSRLASWMLPHHSLPVRKTVPATIFIDGDKALFMDGFVAAVGKSIA